VLSRTHFADDENQSEAARPHGELKMKLRHTDGKIENGTFARELADTVGVNGEKGKWTRCLYRLDGGRVAEALVPASGRPVTTADVVSVRYAD